MSNIASLVTNQVVIMLMLILVGFALTKAKLISETGSKNITDILLTVVTPCVIIKSYQIDFDMNLLKEIVLSFALSTVIMFMFVFVSKLVYAGVKDRYKKLILRFTAIYSNCGFMGIPLLESTLGAKGVLLGSAFLAMFNVFVWSHGLLMFNKEERKFNIASLFKNPGILGVIIAMVLFFSQIRLTGPVKESVNYIASLNTPLAMIVLGTYLARSNLLDSVRQKSVLLSCFVRLIAFPLLTIFVFKILKTEPFMATAIILEASCPSAAIAAMFAQKNNEDTAYPSQIVSVSTVLSVLTLPVISYIANIVL